MVFQPAVNEALAIDGVVYRVAEHPSVPGLPYGQEGRAATVYQLVAGSERRALKVFKPRFQVPGLVGLSERLAPYGNMPGLQVCRRTVLTARRHTALLQQHRDLTYSVLMPWVTGPTWTEVLLGQRLIAPETSLAIARALADVLAGLEEQGLAHGDLAAANVLLPAMAGGPADGSPVALVDVEQMYGPDLKRPDSLTTGSAGYNHPESMDGHWNATMDRFAGAVLLAEMLGWCDMRVRAAAWGESYFDPAEMQQPSERARLLQAVLRTRWGAAIAEEFARAWQSTTLADCPTFGTWLVSLPERVPLLSGESTIQSPVYLPPTAFTVADGIAPIPAQPVPTRRPVSADEVIPPLEGDRPGSSLTPMFDATLRAYQSSAGEREGETRDKVREQADYLRTGQRIEIDPGEASPNRAIRRRPVWIAVAGMGLIGMLVLSVVALANGQSSLQTLPLAAASQTALVLSSPFATSTTATNQPVQAGSNAQATVDATGQSTRTAQVVVAQVATAQAEMAVESAQTATREAALKTATVVAAADKAATVTAVAKMATAEAEQVALASTSTAVAQDQQRALATEISVRTATAQAVVRVEVELQSLHNTAIAVAAFQGEQATATQRAFIQDAQATVRAQVTSAAAATIQAKQLTATALAQPPPIIAPGNLDKLVQVRKWVVGGSNTESIAFNPKGEILATGSNDGGVRIWRIADGTLLRTLRGHTDSISEVLFASSGLTLASASLDGTAHVWRVADGSPLQVLADPGRQLMGMALGRDGESLITSSGDSNDVRLWRISDGSLLHVFSGTASGGAVAIAPDGGSMVIPVARTSSTGWTEDIVQEIHLPDGAPGRLFSTDLGADIQHVDVLAFSPNGSILAIAVGTEAGLSSSNPTEKVIIQLWDVAHGTLLHTLSGHTKPLLSMTFSPDGQLLASAGSGGDDTVRLWRVADGAPLRVLSGSWGSPTGVAFSPDGRMLGFSCGEGTVRLWAVH